MQMVRPVNGYQDSPLMNAYFDQRDWTLDEAIRDPGAPFLSYSNIHLRRVPMLNQYLSQVKLTNTTVTWIAENPWLIGTYAFGSLFISIIGILFIDSIAIRFYAYRLGIRCPRPLFNFLRRQGRTEPVPMGTFRLSQPAQDDLIGCPDRITSANTIHI